MRITKSFIRILALLIMFSNINLFAQVNSKILRNSSNEIEINLTFNNNKYLIEQKKISKINYYLSRDVSESGKPSLPSVQVYIAIPPNSKVKSLNLLHKKNIYLKNIIPETNPVPILKNDSTVSYKKSEVLNNFFNTNKYPNYDVKVIDYVWLGNFYCVSIKINTHHYFPDKRALKVLLSANLLIKMNKIKDFRKNFSNESYYEKKLNSIILNYKQAIKYRSYRPLNKKNEGVGEWIDYSKEYVKLAIVKDGLYKIDYNDLQEYGISPELINPKTLEIFWKGKQIPIYISGEDDLSFNTQDYIIFWATKNYGSKDYRKIVSKGEDYFNYMNRYSDTTIVWLTWGTTNGQRATIQNISNLNLTDTLSTFVNVEHIEQDKRLWYYDAVQPQTQLPFWQENKVWTWFVIGSSGSRKIDFSAANIVPNTNVSTFIRLISNAANIQNNAHLIGTSLNSTSITDSISYDFKQTVNLVTYYPSSELNDGSNYVRVFGLPTEASFHQSLIDWVDINYVKYLTANKDSLYFYFPDSISKKERIIKISGISSSNDEIMVFKVKPNIKKINGFNLIGNNNKTLIFSDTVSGGDAFVILKNSLVQQPIFKIKKKFKNLRDANLGADYVLLSNKYLKSSVNKYYGFVKSNYDFRSQLVYVSDVYDEFSYGMVSAEAIKDFLIYANDYWEKPSPSYLTIIGSANYDYYNVVEPAPTPRKKNLVPGYGDPVSDVWFTVWDSTQNNIPQMYVGRIPAEANEDVIRYLTKHQAYLERPFDEWNKKYLLFSGGDAANPSELNLLKIANDRVNSEIIMPKPIGGNSVHFYKTINPATNFGPFTHEQIQQNIDDGALVISYIGHSGTQTWDNGITDISDIKNTYNNRFPLITDFGCSTGKFAEPDVEAFSELAVCSSDLGQAICYLGNSSFGYTSSATAYPSLFYTHLLYDSATTFGQAHFLAKINLLENTGQNLTSRVFLYSNLLFGDPAIVFKKPAKPNFSIKQNDIVVDQQNVNTDSVGVNFVIKNFGKVLNDSISVLITDTFNGQVSYNKKIKILQPLFKKQLLINIPVKNKIGLHNLSINVNSDRTVDEIYDDDNIANVVFNVFSKSIRSLNDKSYYSTIKNKLDILNPSVKPNNIRNTISLELSASENISNPILFNKRIDPLHTIFNIPNLRSNKRYWWRSKIDDNSDWSPIFSFIKTNDDFTWFIDSTFKESDISFSKINFDKNIGAWILDSGETQLKITSAGANDGGFGSIIYNSVEYLPNSFYWGIATARLDSLTLEPFDIRFFVGTQSQSNADSLIHYISSLSNGDLLVLVISLDAAQTVIGYTSGTSVRKKIKELGSAYIDSIGYRESWCIIGKKGAQIGTVPEIYKKVFQGTAIIDTSIFVNAKEGVIRMPQISSVKKWSKIKLNYLMPTGTKMVIIPLAQKISGSIDTLSKIQIISDIIDITDINATTYPNLSFDIQFTASSDLQSPQLKSLGVSYTGVPELGTNYQVVSIVKDTLKQGEDAELSFYVYNVGESSADSFNVKVDLVKSDNSHINILSQIVDSLGSENRKLFNVNYSTVRLTGNYSFNISIDSDNSILELYEDNNFYSVPFSVKGDSSKPDLNITFDGTDLIDGDYISSNPQIQIQLDDPSLIPITDTSAIDLFLNNQRINYLNNNDIDVVFNQQNPKVIVNYNPEFKSGSYVLTVFGKNTNGFLSDSAGVTKTFVVDEEAKLLDVYNYPNPAQNETYFTFRLPTIPDEIRIKVYTIAGRLIKSFDLNSGELNLNFNKIFWDLRDEDGDKIANGVYLYKMMMKSNDKSQQFIQKLAIVR